MKNIVFCILLVAFGFAGAAQWEGNSSQPTSARKIDGKTFYEITSAAELAWVAIQVNSGNTAVNAILMNDIVFGVDDATRCTKSWTPIGNSSSNTFQGILDGNGYTIYGLYIKMTGAAGLVGYNGAEGVVKKIIMENGYVEGSTPTGALVAHNAGLVSMCVHNGTVVGGYTKTKSEITFASTGSTSKSGGIVGVNEGVVSYCINKGEIRVETSATSTVSGSSTSASASASATAGGGGIVGENKQDAVVENCLNLGIGTITAKAYASSYKQSNADATSKSFTGGIVGINSGFIVNTLNLSAGLKAVASASTGGIPSSVTPARTYRTAASGCVAGQMGTTGTGSDNYYDGGVCSNNTYGIGTASTIGATPSADVESEAFLNMLNTSNGTTENTGVWEFGFDFKPTLAFVKQITTNHVGSTVNIDVHYQDQVISVEVKPESTDEEIQQAIGAAVAAENLDAPGDYDDDTYNYKFVGWEKKCGEAEGGPCYYEPIYERTEKQVAVKVLACGTEFEQTVNITDEFDAIVQKIEQLATCDIQQYVDADGHYKYSFQSWKLNEDGSFEAVYDKTPVTTSIQYAFKLHVGSLPEYGDLLKPSCSGNVEIPVFWDDAQILLSVESALMENGCEYPNEFIDELNKYEFDEWAREENSFIGYYSVREIRILGIVVHYNEEIVNLQYGDVYYEGVSTGEIIDAELTKMGMTLPQDYEDDYYKYKYVKWVEAIDENQQGLGYFVPEYEKTAKMTTVTVVVGGESIDVDILVKDSEEEIAKKINAAVANAANENVSAPADYSDDTYDYKFEGWIKDEDGDYVPEYSKTAKSMNVIALTGGRAVIVEILTTDELADIVAKIETALAKSNIAKPADYSDDAYDYKYEGWTTDVDGNYVPKYSKTAIKKDEPAEETPDEDKPSTDKPSTDEPAEETPDEDKPSTDKPSTDEPAEETPDEDKPSTDKPSSDEPAEETPDEDKPTTGKPSEENSKGDKGPSRIMQFASLRSFNVEVSGRVLTISNARIGSKIAVYNVSGRLVVQSTVTLASQQIRMPDVGTYFVKVNGLAKTVNVH